MGETKEQLIWNTIKIILATPIFNPNIIELRVFEDFFHPFSRPTLTAIIKNVTNIDTCILSR